jgi:GDPmannose 4,6-dehydratase
VIVEVDPQFYRPAEVDIIVGSADKAKHQLGWVLQVAFADLVEMMVRSDYDRVAKL